MCTFSVSLSSLNFGPYAFASSAFPLFPDLVTFALRFSSGPIASFHMLRLRSRSSVWPTMPTIMLRIPLTPGILYSPSF